MGEVRVTIGVDVLCSDGPYGHVRRLIVDPAENTLTHLEVGDDKLPGWLVPADEIAEGGAEVVLRSSTADLTRFEAALEERPTSWPYNPEEKSGRFPAGVEEVERDSAWGNVTTERDRIPAGGLEVRRGEPVYATDGMVGRTRGVCMELPSRRLTFLVLDAGHLWARTRLSIPIGSVKRIADGIQLDISKSEAQSLAGSAGA